MEVYDHESLEDMMKFNFHFHRTDNRAEKLIYLKKMASLPKINGVITAWSKYWNDNMNYELHESTDINTIFVDIAKTFMSRIKYD
jgi:hypothetical protein